VRPEELSKISSSGYAKYMVQSLKDAPQPVRPRFDTGSQHLLPASSVNVWLDFALAHSMHFVAPL